MILNKKLNKIYFLNKDNKHNNQNNNDNENNYYHNKYFFHYFNLIIIFLNKIKIKNFNL